MSVVGNYYDGGSDQKRPSPFKSASDRMKLMFKCLHMTVDNGDRITNIG